VGGGGVGWGGGGGGGGWEKDMSSANTERGNLGPCLKGETPGKKPGGTGQSGL